MQSERNCWKCFEQQMLVRGRAVFYSTTLSIFSPIAGLARPLGLQEIEAPSNSRNRHMSLVRTLSVGKVM